MSEMIERVARAIFSDRYPGEDWKEYQKRDYCGHARAAIEAMRVPTEPMLKAIYDLEQYAIGGHAWQAAIDAALSTPNTDKT